MESSEALEQRIHDEIKLMDKSYSRITACRVVIERPSNHHRNGENFHVKVELSVPGRVLSVSRCPSERKSSKDAYAAVNEAFGSMRRQLQNYVGVRRGL
jgi:ribosome-associated translation inhibitor RaiA